MYSRRSSWRTREFFREDESENLFYDFTPDHQMSFLWEDGALEDAAQERLGVRSEAYMQLHSLTEKGYLEVLRRLKRAKAPLSEKKGMLEQIEAAVRMDRENREGALKYLRSFCDAIGYYSEKDKMANQKRARMRSLAVLLAVLCITALLGFALAAVRNPTQYFPVRHMYATSFFGQEKLIDVSYQLNQLTGIAFYDEKGNLKTELTGDNSWGQYSLDVYEPAAGYAGDRTVHFSGGSAVPQSVTESGEEGGKRSVCYLSNGLIKTVYDKEGDADIPDSHREIHYSADGITTTAVVTNYHDYRFYNALHEPIYEYKTEYGEENDENNRRTVYRDGEGRIIGVEEMKTLFKDYGAVRVMKYTLGNGEIQSYSVILRAGGLYSLSFPKEEIFTAHPESRKEYASGRLIRESWGPLPESLECYFEYMYDDAGNLAAMDEYSVSYESGEPVRRQRYIFNEQGHLSEIRPPDNLYAPYNLSIEYDEALRISRVRQFLNVYEPALEMEYTCAYGDDGSLKCIRVEDGEGEHVADLFVGPDGEIVDFQLPDRTEQGA